MYKAKSVEHYIEDHAEHRPELELLRELVNIEPLNECIKWGAPCYEYKKKNVVGLGSFKSYVGLWFYQGALLTDAENKLINAQEEVTKAMRQWRFENIEEIRQNGKLIQQYCLEACKLVDDGREIKADKKQPLIVPKELSDYLSQHKLSSAFEAFSLSRKREFTEHIASAKREATKLARLDKIGPMIRDGIGLNDKYRK